MQPLRFSGTFTTHRDLPNKLWNEFVYQGEKASVENNRVPISADYLDVAKPYRIMKLGESKLPYSVHNVKELATYKCMQVMAEISRAIEPLRSRIESPKFTGDLELGFSEEQRAFVMRFTNGTQHRQVFMKSGETLDRFVKRAVKQ